MVIIAVNFQKKISMLILNLFLQIQRAYYMLVMQEMLHMVIVLREFGKLLDIKLIVNITLMMLVNKFKN